MCCRVDGMSLFVVEHCSTIALLVLSVLTVLARCHSGIPQSFKTLTSNGKLSQLTSFLRKYSEFKMLKKN